MTSSPGGPNAGIIAKMCTSVDEIRKLGARVQVDRPPFLSVVYLFDEFKLILSDLGNKPALRAAEYSQELARLGTAITCAQNAFDEYSKRSRMFLFLHLVEVVQNVQDMVQEIGYCLNLVPILSFMSSVSLGLHEKLADVRVRMRTICLEAKASKVALARTLKANLQQFGEDDRAASEFLRQFLQQMNLSVGEVGVLSEEVQRDIVTAKSENRTDDILQLQQLQAFLDRASTGSNVHRVAVQSSAGERVRKQLADQAPKEFKCALSGNIMCDPVTLQETGINYERSAIEEWFATGHTSCPGTGTELRLFDLLPNPSLRLTIEEDLECLNQKALAVSISSLDAQFTSLTSAVEVLALLTADRCYAQHVASIGGVPPLVNLIAGADVPRDAIAPALQALGQIGSLVPTCQVEIAEVGAIPPLLRMCQGEDSEICIAALQALLALCGNPTIQSKVTEETGVIALIKLLNAHKDGDEIGTCVEQVLEKFWRSDSYVAIQMASGGMFKPLVALLDPEIEFETRLLMADAVMTWGVNMASRVEIVEAGVVPPLLDLLSNGPAAGAAPAVRALEHLSHTEVNRVALAKSGVIPALVKARRRGSLEVKEAAAATLSNLAMDDQDLDALDEEGAILRLLTLLRTEDVASREYPVRTLQAMVKDSKTMRAYVLQDMLAVPAIFETLREAGAGFATGSLRSVTLLLLGSLCKDPSASEAMIASPKDVHALTNLLDRPIPLEEREAIIFVLASMSENKSMHEVVLQEGHVVPTLSKCLDTSSAAATKEKAFIALASLAQTPAVDNQLKIARSGVLPLAVQYLQLGPDKMRIPAIRMMGALSLSTPLVLGSASQSSGDSGLLGFARVSPLGRTSSLSKAASFLKFPSKKMPLSPLSKAPTLPFSKTPSLPFSGGSPGGSPTSEKRRACRVHSGRCSLDATFCLVEGDVLPILLQLLEKADTAVKEVAIDAIGTLLAGDADDSERAAEYLVKQNVIHLASNLVGESEQASEKAIGFLDRIFHHKKYQAPRYSQLAISALGRHLTGHGGNSKKRAAECLSKLGISPQVSATES
eukprot:TRINITY_DN9745_c0_g2_i1.p1 TRINITY_DN9745_c0_g2~~TRINITY_DN9745_c0_g2_i1.p1  ORF type:complete len:1058 (+),score=127.54 TRINITY_DN9745_c0_g2_i1:397-3570(+)